MAPERQPRIGRDDHEHERDGVDGVHRPIVAQAERSRPRVSAGGSGPGVPAGVPAPIGVRRR